MTAISGPHISTDEHGNIVVDGYRITQAGPLYTAITAEPLTDAEQEYGVLPTITCDDMPSLLLLVSAQLIKRDMIRRAAKR